MITDLTSEKLDRAITDSGAGAPVRVTVRGNGLWLTAILIFAALVTTACVNLAYEQGPLVSTPRYDDVSYFVYALRHLHYLDHFGFVAFVIDHFRHPPHSPLSTLLAYFAFGILGKNVWSCYAANFFVVAAFFLSVAWVTRVSSRWVQATALLYASTIAFTTCCVWNFRPDMFWGVCTAFASFYILQGSLKIADKRYLLCAASLTALALLSKPTIFPATIISVGAALLLQLVADRAATKGQFYRQLLNGAKIVGLSLLLAAPYYLANIKHLAAYIKEVVFGRTAQIASFSNAVGGSVAPAGDLVSKLAEWRCYFDGYAGMANFGGNQYILVSLIVVAAVVFVCQRRQRQLVQLVCAIVLLLVMFAIPTFTSAKGTFFASNFVAALILLGLWSFSQLAAGKRLLQTCLVSVGFVLLALLSVSLKTPLLPHRADPSVANENRGFEQIYTAMSQRAGDREINFACTTEGPFLAYDFLFRSALSGKSFDYWRSGIADEYPPADFVIAQEDGVVGTADTTKLQSQLLARLHNDPDYQVASTWSSWNGKQVVLFERLGDFYAVDGLYGLASTQWSGPVWRIRVANSQRCGLKLQNHNASAGGTLVLGCVPQPGVRGFELRAEGQTLANYKFRQSMHPEEITAKIPAQLGANPVIDVVFDRAATAGAASVTFTKMKFVDVPGRALVCKRDQGSVLSYPQSPLDTREW